MSRLPPLPELDWREDGRPVHRGVGDVYFSSDGLSEKRAVFLGGCGLPEGWAGRERYCIGELGFGSGLTVLATSRMWRAHRPSHTARLDIVSFERAILPREAAARVHAMWPELAEESAILLQRWPERARGVQRIALGDGVVLTLMIDEVEAALPRCAARIDAWFLDGFAPSKNAEMWSPSTLAHVVRLSAPGARAATYSVAASVRQGLEVVGFRVAKRPGHGAKKDRLEAVLGDAAGARACRPGAPRSVAILGAGIAGASAARAFVDRGCRVSVVDAGPAPGAGASGNPVALLMPRLDAADGLAARALLSGYLAALACYRDAPAEAAALLDVRHLARMDRERQRFARLAADPPLDATRLAPLDPDDPGAGALHRSALALRPAALLPWLLRGAELIFAQRVAAIQGGARPALVLADGRRIDADLIVLCAGHRLAEFPQAGGVPMQPRLGQVECCALVQPAGALADGGYVVSAFGGLVVGSTFEDPPMGQDGPEAPVTEAARASNLATLARLRPELGGLDPSGFVSRAAIRAATSDRFPVAGALPAELSANLLGRVQVIGGLGARGYLWAPLLADIVASEAFGEPLPLESDARDALRPDRFIERARRRGGFSS